jgi:hypothetical protein
MPENRAGKTEPALNGAGRPPATEEQGRRPGRGKQTLFDVIPILWSFAKLPDDGFFFFGGAIQCCVLYPNRYSLRAKDF